MMQQPLRFQRSIELGLFGLVVILILSIVLLAGVPPVSRDALTHHLAVPKLWIKHGGIYEIPDIRFSYYPMNLDLLYAFPLYFDNDIIPKYIHFAFALATAWLIYGYLNQKTNRVYALIGVLLFLSTPVIVKLSTTVYVDLGLIFFSFASLCYLIRWRDNGFHLKYLFISAIFCGLALGTKYNGLISFFLLSCLTSYIYVKSYNKDTKIGKTKYQLTAFKYGLFFIVISCIVYMPWMVKNYIWTGNPLYPLYNQHFKTASQKQTAPVYREFPSASIEKTPDSDTKNSWRLDSHFLVRKHVYGESWWETVTIPIRIFFQGQDNNPKYFDGKLNPFLLILPLISLFRLNKLPDRFKQDVQLFAFFSILYLLFVFFQIDMRIRWVAPIVPALVILAIIGLFHLAQFIRDRITPTALIFCWGSFWLMLSLFFLLNTFYILNLFKKVDPITYLSGRIGRDAYIQKFRQEYSLIRFANRNIPKDAVILCLFLGNRRYYHDREVSFNYNFFKKVIKYSDSAQLSAETIKKAGITHLLVRNDLFNQWTQEIFTIHEKNAIINFFSAYTKTLLQENGHSLVKLL